MKTKLLAYFIISIIFKVSTLAQSISGDVWETCPKNNTTATYTVGDLAANCNVSWSVTNGTVVSGATSRSLTVKWDQEPIYVNGDENLYYNDGKYPEGTVTVTSTSCNKTKSAKVLIKSVKSYRINSVIVTYNSNSYRRYHDETSPIDLTNYNGNVSLDLNDVYVRYIKSTGHEIIDYVNRFEYSLPTGWSAVGQSESTFEAGANITLIPPCTHSTVGESREVKVKVVSPGQCLVDGEYQKGAEFKIKFRKDPSRINSLTSSVSNLKWGESRNFTINASVYKVNGTSYEWELSNGYSSSSNLVGSLTTSSLSINVNFSGCNTTGIIKLHLKQCNKIVDTKSLDLDFTYPTLSGADKVCSSLETFAINNLPAGATVSWSVSPTSLFGTDIGTGSSFSTNASSSSSNGSGTIAATVYAACGSSFSVTKSVWVGKPTTPSINCPAIINVGQIKFAIASSNGSNTYNWWTSYNYINIQGQEQNSIEIKGAYPGREHLFCRANNACGSSTYTYKTITVEGFGPGPLSIAPNPASNEINLTLDTETDNISEFAKSFDNNEGYLIRIVNGYGLVVYSEMVYDKKIRLGVSNWNKGLYYVCITNNGKSCSGTFIVE